MDPSRREGRAQGYRNLAKFRITPGALEKLISATPTTSTFPKDARILMIYADNDAMTLRAPLGGVWVVAEHESFPRVDIGMLIPEIAVTFTSRGGEAR